MRHYLEYTWIIWNYLELPGIHEKSSEESDEEEKEEKTKNARIATKIGTKTKFGTTNSKIVVPNPKKQRIDHAHAPPLQNEKCSDRDEN